MEETPQQQPPAESSASKALTVALLLISVVLVGFWIRQDKSSPLQSSAPGAPGKGKIGTPAPNLILKDLEGRTVSLADLKGKVVIVDFWATWCQPCVIMIPWFIEFRNRFGSQGLEIVGVAMDDEGVSVVKPYAQEKQMNYPVVMGSEEAANEWGGIFGLPTTFIIDRQGIVRNRHVGLVSKDEFEKDIRSLL